MSDLNSSIIGIRILIEIPQLTTEYYVKYEFTGNKWKESAIKILPDYLGYKDVKIQTLHLFTSSCNLYTGQIMKPSNIWLDNFYFKLEDIL